MAIHPFWNKKLRPLFWPIIVATKWLGRNYPETLVRIRYFVRFKKFLNLKDPKTLNEKIQYLSFRTDTSLWTPLSDKYKVREYIKAKGLGHILIDNYAYYDNVEDINLKELPDKFVMKTTHGSGDVLLVRDKKELNQEYVKKYFAPFLKSRYGELEGGRHYMRIKPGLTVEALIENDLGSKKYSKSLIDYKFWCFNGEPQYCWVCCNRDKTGTDVLLYDKDWNVHPEYSIFGDEYRKGEVMPKPTNYEEMLEICRILSKEFPCVSVDLYNIGGKIYFGELTFTRLGGLINFFTNDWLVKAGSEVRLPGIDY